MATPSRAVTSEQPSQQRASSRNLGVLRAILRFLVPYKLRILAASIALVFTAIVTLMIGQGVRILVDQGFGDSSGAGLNQAILVFVGLAFLLAIGTFARFYLVSWLGERVTADIRKAVYKHVVALHPAFFETQLSSEIQSRITTDTTLLQTIIGSSVSMALRNMLIFVGGLLWMAFTNFKLTAVAFLIVPLVILPLFFFGRKVRILSRKNQDQIAGIGSRVSESLKNIKVLQAFNRQQGDAKEFDEAVEASVDVAMSRIAMRAWLTAVVITMVLGAVATMLWIGGQDVMSGKITTGELAAFMFYAIMVAGSVGVISEVYGDLQRAAGATERLLELLHAENLIDAPAVGGLPISHFEGELQFNKVSFYYPSKPDDFAIKQLSLHIPAGTSLALVGSSGAGKSTLVDLLLRFYDVQEGVIKLDNNDIRYLSPSTLREQLALVPQQPTLFSGSVKYNIQYGSPQATMEDIKAAAKAAHANEFIEQLPDGYDSYIGESGLRLSGGQRQRIAIARALLKNPKVLLLDEATSALDAESEHQVQQALEDIMQHRTTIVIAHRLATVKNVDCIAVLDKGRLVATGTHQQLIERSPLYARWASLQFGDEQQLNAELVINSDVV